MRIRHYIHIFVFLFISAVPSALAKHVAAAIIEPIVHKGVRYVVPNDKGLRAYVEAWDVQTGRKLWTKTVFRHWYVPIPFGRTECMHYEWITSMALQTDILIFISERGRKYALDTRTGTIRPIKETQPNYVRRQTTP